MNFFLNVRFQESAAFMALPWGNDVNQMAAQDMVMLKFQVDTIEKYPEIDLYPGFQKCFTDSECQHRPYAGDGRDRTRDREVENIEKTGNFKQ